MRDSHDLAKGILSDKLRLTLNTFINFHTFKTSHEFMSPMKLDIANTLDINSL